MSRIVRFNQTGGPEVLKIENIEIPPPKARNQLLFLLCQH